MKACPKCKSYSRHRMNRRGIVKHIPGFKAYECGKCAQTYVWNSYINKAFKTSYK